MLNDSSDAKRCERANCSVWRSANEKPKPCTRPKANVTSQRRLSADGKATAELAETAEIFLSVLDPSIGWSSAEKTLLSDLCVLCGCSSAANTMFSSAI